MNIYFWRHNKTYHSHSMIEEPCLNSDFYLDVIAIVAANSQAEAIEKLLAENPNWRAEDLQNHPPKIFTLEEATVIFTDLRGNIAHL